MCPLADWQAELHQYVARSLVSDGEKDKFGRRFYTTVEAITFEKNLNSADSSQDSERPEDSLSESRRPRSYFGSTDRNIKSWSYNESVNLSTTALGVASSEEKELADGRERQLTCLRETLLNENYSRT